MIHTTLKNVVLCENPPDKLPAGGAARLAYLLQEIAAQGSIPRITKLFQRKKMLMLLRLINGAAKKKVDSGLKMLYEPI